MWRRTARGRAGLLTGLAGVPDGLAAVCGPPPLAVVRGDVRAGCAGAAEAHDAVTIVTSAAPAASCARVKAGSHQARQAPIRLCVGRVTPSRRGRPAASIPVLTEIRILKPILKLILKLPNGRRARIVAPAPAATRCTRLQPLRHSRESGPGSGREALGASNTADQLCADRAAGRRDSGGTRSVPQGGHPAAGELGGAGACSGLLLVIRPFLARHLPQRGM